MSVTYTTKMALEKPTVGNSNDVWGTELNRTFDLIDDAVISNNFAQGTHVGLTFTYKNGKVLDGQTATVVSGGTLSLTNNNTNYIEVTPIGVVSSNTTGFTIGSIPLYTVLTISGAISTITDLRAYFANNFSGKVVVDSSGNVKIGDSSNYTQFNTTGRQLMVGGGRCTKLLKIPARYIGIGTVAPTSNLVGNYLECAYTINDNSCCTVSMPEDIDTSAPVNIYAVWHINEAYATNSGEVRWRFAWSLCPTDGSETSNSPTHTGSTDTADINIPATINRVTRTLLVTIPNTSISEGDILGFVFSRIALSGGTNPTAEPAVLCLEIEYTSNRLGKST